VGGARAELPEINKLWNQGDAAGTPIPSRRVGCSPSTTTAATGASSTKKRLDAFWKLAALDAAQGAEPDLYNLKDQSRLLRLLGRGDEAMGTLGPALERLAGEQKQDGWISEEHAECLLAQGKNADAAPHFAVAYELLSKDSWVLRHDPQKRDRLKKMSSGVVS
jgi:hypothetical protein